MGCSSVCSTKACRTGADSGFGGMSRLRLPSQMPAISVSGPRFLRVLTSMLDGSVKMSPGLRILQFLSTGHFVSSKLVAWSPFAKDGMRTVPYLRARGSSPPPLDRGPALSHPAGELVHVEIVPPGADLAVPDLEGPHDLQLERLARELEDVHPLGHHDRTACCDVDEAEVEALDAWRARADERRDVVRDGRPAGDRRERDIVVDGVVGEKCGELGGADIGVPRRAEPAHYLDRALHLAPPAVDPVGTPPGTHQRQAHRR